MSVTPHLSHSIWTAKWITHSLAKQYDYGVYHFRKNFHLNTIPALFMINISADNRYRLFINGHPVCSGPARGDLSNWFFETLNLTPYLKKDNNTIAVLVWNMGKFAPMAQISRMTAFILQGQTEIEKIINTDTSWKVMINKAYTPCSLHSIERLNAYIVVGPGDQVNAMDYPWGWENENYIDKNWENAKEVIQDPNLNEDDNHWTLVPRTIPIFDEHVERFSIVRRVFGVKIDKDFLKKNENVSIPPYSTVSILLDKSINTIAYPEIILSGGKNTLIQLVYAESLFDAKGNKGNRNEIKNKKIFGNYDNFKMDGGKKRKFRPLWFRTYRYLQINIITKDTPVILNDIYSMTTGYPFEMKASFSCNDHSLQKIWKVGWHTAKLCAGELYYDTPYYEQLQYVGDSRIQALISLYISGDDRLMRKAILDFSHSSIPEGLTQSRYPSHKLQVIPAYSLFWISMIYDYWMHRKDDHFVKQFLSKIIEIIEWFKIRIDKDSKMLGPLTWWNFVDWDNFNPRGTAPGADEGNSSIITLQFAYTLKQANEIFTDFGFNKEAGEYSALARKLNKNTFKLCYDIDKHLVADTSDQRSYSQHAGIWAILSGAIPNKYQKQMITRLLEDKTIGQVTFFYHFYLTQALKKIGMADLYYGKLTPWRDMLKLNLTTFAEKPEPTRSDCHAWSASPIYDFLATICGIMPNASGFQRVMIKPSLGELHEAEGIMPHPKGMISVKLKRMGIKGIKAIITLPSELRGTFIWKKKKIELHGGEQIIKI